MKMKTISDSKPSQMTKLEYRGQALCTCGSLSRWCFVLALLASLTNVSSVKEICSHDFETACSILTAQDLAKTAARRLIAANSTEQVNKVFHDVNFSAEFHPSGGFFVIVTYVDRFLAHGGDPTNVNKTYETAFRQKGIVADPNLIRMQYYGGLVSEVWVTYSYNTSPLLPVHLKRAFCMKAQLFDGTVVSASSGYLQIDPTVENFVCNRYSFQPCSTAIAELLVTTAWATLHSDRSSAELASHIQAMNSKTMFRINGFTAFIVNFTDGGRFLASGKDNNTYVGLTWSEVAKKVGATTYSDLDGYIADNFDQDKAGSWIEFPWIGSSDGMNYNKNIFISALMFQGSMLYVGSMVRDPSPYIVYTDYTMNNALFGLAVAAIVLLSLAYLAQAAVIVYYRKSTLIRMSSPILVLASLFGGLMITVGSILYFLFPNDGTNHLCLGRAWVIPIGLSLMINPILVKTYRVSILLSTMKKVNNMKGGFVFSLTMALLVPPLLILAGTSGEAMTSFVTTSSYTEVGPYVNLNQCQDQVERFVPLILWYFSLICVCFYLAYKVRNAPDGFNEASYIYTACSFLLTYNILIVPIQFLLNSSPSALGVLRGFGAMLGAFVFTGAITLPKMYHIYNGEQDSADLKKLQTVKTHSSGSKPYGATSASGMTIGKIIPLNQLETVEEGEGEGERNPGTNG